MQKPVRFGIWIALASLAATAAAPGRQTASNTEPEKYTALAVNISNVGYTGATPVDIVIERYTTDAESQRLLAILKKEGQDGLLKALRDTPRVGYIRSPASLAYDLRYARQVPGEDGGKAIVLATDRPIGFWEAAARPRSMDYPFTFIELHVNDEGEGKGSMTIATRLTLNGPVLAIENLGNQPVMLNEVKRRK